MSKLAGVLLAWMWVSGCDAPADGDAGSEPATDATLTDAPASSCEAGSSIRVALPNAIPFTETDVAFDGDGTLVAFATASNDVMLIRYDAGGSPTLERRFAARPSLDAVTVDVAIGVGTAGYSLAYTLPWNEPAAGFGAELFAVQLDRSGAMLGEVLGVSDVYDARGDAVWARQPQIGWADDRVVAAWLENRSVLGPGGMVVRRASLRLERWDAAGTTEGVRVVADLGEPTSVWTMRPGTADRPTYVAWAPIDDGGREVFVASISGAGEPVPVVSFETGNSVTSLILFERDGSSWVAWSGASAGEGELRTGALPMAASWGVSASIEDPTGTAPVLHLAMNDGSAEVDLPLDVGSYFDLAPIEVDLRDGRVRAAVRRREDGGATSIELRDWCVAP